MEYLRFLCEAAWHILYLYVWILNVVYCIKEASNMCLRSVILDIEIAQVVEILFTVDKEPFIVHVLFTKLFWL